MEQVWNISRKKGDTAKKDELFALIKQCKEDETSLKPFLRFVQGAPYPMCFLANDRQMADIVKFCTNPDEFVVLGIDTTYNCGEFWLTTSAYLHLQLRTRRRNKPPVLIGPPLLHKTKDEAAFRYMATCMTRACPDTSNVIAFGSDRDKALYQGFSRSIPNAVHLLCTKHLQDDIQIKLTAMGISGQYRADFMADIFGCEKKQERGLIDSRDKEEFRDRLTKMKETWEKRELSARNTTVAQFYPWFLKYQAKDMEEKALLNVRQKAGLGEEFFYNNAVESSHHTLKTSRNHRMSDWPTILTNFRQLVDRQQRDVERAFVGAGPQGFPYSAAPRRSAALLSRTMADTAESREPSAYCTCAYHVI